MKHYDTMTGYKATNADMQCRGFQYEIGKTYVYNGRVSLCNSGFHACEYPLDVFSYYAPAESTFAIVEASGTIAKHVDDSKIASSVLTVKASIDLPGIIQAAIEALGHIARGFMV
jgi:hypothetical protein